MNETIIAQENPYAAPVAPVADEAPREQELADRLSRLGAVFIDGIFFGFSIVPAIFAMAFVGRTSPANDSQPMDTAIFIGLGLGLLLFFGLVAWNCVLLSRGGQTVAKKMLNIRVVRRDGSHCGLARIFFARYLPVTVLGLIPFIGGLVSLVDALLIFRDDRRCLHDEIADTIVVKA
jgi:uncharacterized RDD family membrane protein YckC